MLTLITSCTTIKNVQNFQIFFDKCINSAQIFEVLKSKTLYIIYAKTFDKITNILHVYFRDLIDLV